MMDWITNDNLFWGQQGCLGYTYDEFIHNLFIQQTNNNRRNNMSKYINIYNDYKDTTLKGKLKPINCKSCEDNGCGCYGECETCLKNQAYNQEYIETHLFIMDKGFRDYHSGAHDTFKSLVLRMPNEHPYLYYGIEIEVEFHEGDVQVFNRDDYDYDEDYDTADEGDNWEIQEILNKFSDITDGMFVYEHDASLDNGVELISRPTSYAFWTSPDTVKKLKKGLEFLKEHGAMVSQPSTNGLHIHISRKFFDYGETKLDDRHKAYEGFDWLFQKFQPEIEQLGGREYTRFCQSKATQLKECVNSDYYATRFNADVEMKCKLKKGGRMAQDDHNSAVNLSGNTIEARVFKSTTDYKQVLADIELVRNFAHAVREEDIKRSLNDLLHTKENLYLDERINKVRIESRRNHKEFDLDKMNDDELEVVVKNL